VFCGGGGGGGGTGGYFDMRWLKSPKWHKKGFVASWILSEAGTVNYKERRPS